MPKQLALVLITAGLIFCATQIFREAPNSVIFLGGLFLTGFGAIGYSDKAEAEERG